MDNIEPDPRRFVRNIAASGISIYTPIATGDPDLWIPTPELEYLLNIGLRASSLAGLPLRTRSKVVKERVCRTLGYPVPTSFKKTRPRFPGQNFDIYTQKSNNLQVWNEELSATRRYVLIRVSDNDMVVVVKVVTGVTLALLDTTGTLTRKYQARCIPGTQATELVSSADTANLTPFLSDASRSLAASTPISHPRAGELLPIAELFRRLGPLVGQSFVDAGYDQERSRGAVLHQLVCQQLGYSDYRDDGRFPDIRHQLLEVKLQTSPTIDLGLVRPASVEPLDVPHLGHAQVRHCDVRYGVFYAHTDGRAVTLSHLVLTTGEAFFSRFPQSQGKVLNKKLQIPLPSNFFTS